MLMRATRKQSAWQGFAPTRKSLPSSSVLSALSSPRSLVSTSSRVCRPRPWRAPPGCEMQHGLVLY